MANRVIVIGDIHGCATALRTLLEELRLDSTDTVITLGDYVDRGPDSKNVIEQLIKLSSECKLSPIMGNHETMMLNVFDGQPPQEWLRHGANDTLDSYGFSGDLSVVPPEHLEFIRNCSDFVESDTHFFLHANYDEDCPLHRLDELALRWRTLDQYLPGPHQNGKIAVVGHTADRSGEILDVGHLKCIDTYCYGGLWLTALDVGSGDVLQANEEGKLRDR